jgi:Ca-activated chloride channel homolog
MNTCNRPLTRRFLSKSLIFGIALVAFSTRTTQAQQSPLEEPQSPPPALMILEDERSTPLQISEVNTEVRIRGHIAETRMTLTFFNPQSRNLAGDLFFPLPEGATISGYALDIEGKMVDGVVVPKDKARRIFEIETRKGIDPGLVEWVKGNNFKTRVFPIPPNGTRTVMVRYVTPLIRDSKAQNYQLPLNFQDKVGKFSLKIEVIKPAALPRVQTGKLANFSFDKWENNFVAKTTLKNQSITTDLMIAIPEVHGDAVQVDRDQEQNVYFSTRLSKLEGNRVNQSQAPQRVALYWDASGSMGQFDRSTEISLIKQYCKRIKDVTIDLVLFRNQMQDVKTFQIKEGKVSELIATLQEVDYDGGTQIGALQPLNSEPDLYILCSDGLSNFGKEIPKSFEAPVYAIGSSTSTNHAFLRFLSQRSGGAYFNLSTTESRKIINSIGESPFSYLKTEIVAGDIDRIYPSVPQPISGDFVLAGRLNSAEATIRIHYGIPGGESSHEDFVIRSEDASNSDLLRTMWAQNQINELMMAPQRNEDALIAVGRQHGLVTPGTSLMVLENLDQYLEYQIAPPTTLPALRKQYLARIQEQQKQQDNDRKKKIDQVLAMWNQRITWWKRNFKYPANLRIKSQQSENAITGFAGGLGGFGGASPDGLELELQGMQKEFNENMQLPPIGEAEADNEMKSEESSDALFDADEANFEQATRKTEKNDAPSIKVKPWNPDTPYLKILKKASKDQRYRTYLSQRSKYADSPAFFLDCANFFQQCGQPQTALQVLSNIVELELENPALYRVAAHRLAQTGELELASMLFETVLKMRPEEPQSYRDLALVLDQLKDFEGASELLNRVVLGDWDRFEEIEVIALMELNRVLSRAKRAGVTIPTVDRRLIKLLDVDVRIILTWDADMTDMDLWITEPSGEQASYNNNRTQIGGMVSRDFTQGYGPEEYLLKKSMKGKYAIDVDYFSESTPSILGPVTLQVEVFTNYGRANEDKKTLTVRLGESKDRLRVGKVTF